MLAFLGHTQSGVAAELRHKGYGLLKARRLAATIDDDTIQTAIAMAPPEVATAYSRLSSTVAGTVGVIGDGSALKALIAAIEGFFQSDTGKALIAILVKILLGGL